jgi:hypothetical protein
MNPANKSFASFDLCTGRHIAGKFEVIYKLGNGWEGEVYKVREVKSKIETAASLVFLYFYSSKA